MPRTVSSARLMTLACVAALVASSATLGANHGVTQGGWIALMSALTFNLLRSGAHAISGSQLVGSMLGAGAFGVACIVLRIDTALSSFVPAYFQALLATLVGRTLRQGRQPAIERIARALQPGQSVAAEQLTYMRRATWLWFGAFAGLAGIHAFVALQHSSLLQVELWAFAFDLGVIATVFVLEFSWRRWRHIDRAEGGLLQFVMNLRRVDPLKLLLS